MSTWKQKQCRYCGRDMFENVGDAEPTCCSQAIDLKSRQDKFDSREHDYVEPTGYIRGDKPHKR